MRDCREPRTAKPRRSCALPRSLSRAFLFQSCRREQGLPACLPACHRELGWSVRRANGTRYETRSKSEHGARRRRSRRRWNATAGFFFKFQPLPARPTFFALPARAGQSYRQTNSGMFDLCAQHSTRPVGQAEKRVRVRVRERERGRKIDRDWKRERARKRMRE